MEKIKTSIKGIVFLSVQGVEKNEIIPHHKIEKLIKEKSIPFVFLRPSYFMRNLTTTLYDDIKRENKIILPAGNALFNWVDVNDIAEVASVVMINFEQYKNEALEITGKELKSFPQVVTQINNQLSIDLKFKSVNPVRYFFYKKRQGYAIPKIMVMILLHFLPRFDKIPKLSTNVEKILNRYPTDIETFINNNESFFKRGEEPKTLG
ncbi:NmrA family NAD(P)-binding protein [Flammeovirga pacifica]|uniref:NmrA family NAD(P)-binding protein n=1 Tax=Flammeovirga pacifica TaxID=915059 RepID=UPI000693C7B5|nr:NmrA family NAD(P)-binding protein [Flammeovirga pacifica]